MQKIVINKGNEFALSKEAEKLYKKSKGIKEDDWLWIYKIERDDPILVEIVEVIGERANSNHADLRILEIPDGVAWCIVKKGGVEDVDYYLKWI